MRLQGLLPRIAALAVAVVPVLAQEPLDREILSSLIDRAAQSATVVTASQRPTLEKNAKPALERLVKAQARAVQMKTAAPPPTAVEVQEALDELKAASEAHRLARLPLDDLDRLDQRRAFNPTDNPLLYTLFFAAKISAQDLMAQIETLRTDKQIGAPPQAAGAGTTSLVSKGTVPAVLGFAVETGSMSRTTNATSVTFRGNVVGLFDLIRESGFIASYAESDATSQFLRRISYSVSFDPARELAEGAEVPSSLTFSGSTRQIAGYSVRFDIVNQRDPRREPVRQIWQRFTDIEARELNTRLNAVFQPVFVTDEYKALIESRFPAVTTATPDQVRTVSLAFADEFWTMAQRLNPNLEQTVRAAVRAAVDYAKKRDEILQEMGKLPVIAFEYIQERPRAGPHLSKLNVVADAQIFRGKGSFAGNTGVTLFNSREGVTAPGSITTPGVTRDFYASADLTLGLGAITGSALQIGNVTLSLAGKYERIFDGALYARRLGEIGVTDIPTTLATPGDLGIVQAKLVIPIKNTGVKIPLSISYANRTELIKEKEVRGQFGLTFDFDQVVNHFKGMILPGGPRQ